MSNEQWRQVKDIFNAVLRQKPEVRRQFLNDVCGGDEETRREVESLLASYNDAESFMENPAVGEVAEVIRQDKNLDNGVCFGHYEIIEQIGAGGMGEVYLAQDKKLDRKVAIKILNEKFARHESNLQRFTQEAKAASGLNHPNILVIHEIGEAEDAHFIVSEFIEGKTLRDGFKKLPLKLPEVLDIAAQIANALSAAHAARIIHRDIKPENIMIRPDGFVKILDFGLAKLVEQKAVGFEDATVKQNQTAKGIILGTVNYMSPEQAKGERVDERTDIFSFGALIYEMIAGRTPFAGDSMSETIANLINREPETLSRFAANVPDELQRIVSKTLRKNKDERYQSVKDLLIDLKSLQKRLEFEAELLRDGETVRQRDRERRRRRDGETERQRDEEIVAKTQPYQRPSVSSSHRPNSVAVLPFTNMSNDAENEYFCDGLAEELLNALAKIDDLNVAARTSAFSFKGKNTSVSEIGNILNVNTILEGSVRKSSNRVRITVQLINAADGFQLWSERYDREMRDIFDVQDEITLAVIEALKVKLLGAEKAAVLKRYTDNPKAYEFYLKGVYYRWKIAPEEFRKCGCFFQQAARADPTFALAYFGLCSYYGYGTAWGLLTIPPEEGWAKAEAAMAKVLELDATLPEILIGNAFNLVHYRKWDEAGKDIEQAAEENPKFPEIHHLYSFYLLAVGQFDEAIAEAEKALELDPLSVNYSRFLGVCFFFARRHDEAIGQFRKTLELEPNNSSVHEILGGVLAQTGMFDQAIAEWQRATILEGDDELTEIFSRSHTEANFITAVCAAAEKRIERLNARAAGGEYVPAINFARAFVMLGDKEQAFRWLEKAVEERNVFPLMMNSDPFYDRLRSDPRFQTLLRRIGLPGDESTDDKKTNEAKTETLKATADSTAESQIRKSSAANFKNRKHIYILSLIILLLTAGGFGYYFRSAKKPASGAGGKKSLAVLPFVNASQNPDAEYLSDGITESIINNLSQLAGLKVMSRNSAFRFKNNQIDTKNIASQLGVETLVTGDIKQIGDRFVINVRLINASDDSQIWGNQYVKTNADIIAAQNEIARAVASNLRLKLTSAEQQQLSKNYTENAEAYQLYLRGRFHIFKLTTPETFKGISYFQQAIEIDPNYALAYTGMADGYRGLALGSEMPPIEFLSKSKRRQSGQSKLTLRSPKATPRSAQTPSGNGIGASPKVIINALCRLIRITPPRVCFTRICSPTWGDTRKPPPKLNLPENSTRFFRLRARSKDNFCCTPDEPTRR